MIMVIIYLNYFRKMMLQSSLLMKEVIHQLRIKRKYSGKQLRLTLKLQKRQVENQISG